MTIRVLLASVFILIVGVISSSAQDDLSNPLAPQYERAPIYIGPVFGFNRAMHTVTLQSFPNDLDPNQLCNPFENGTANGFFAGLSWEYLLGDIENSNSSIIVRALYNTFPSELEAAGDTYPSRVDILDDQNNVIRTDVINSTTNNLNEITYNVFTLEAMYKINPIQGLPLGFTAGPTFDFAMVKEQNQTMNLVDPQNAIFTESLDPAQAPNYINDGRTYIAKEGEIEESQAFRFGLKLGVQYEILTSSKLYIVPGIFYNLGITNLSAQEDWRVNAIQMGVDLRWAF